MNIRRTNLYLIFLVVGSTLAACETMPRDAFRLSESSLRIRELQTREYESASDAAILSASIAVVQDMGYTVDEIEKPLGVLSASKRENATDRMEAIGTLTVDAMQCVATFLLGCNGKRYGKIDDVQDIRLTLIARPQVEDQRTVSVRITIQRAIWDKRGRLSKQQTITDQEVYQSFFAKLSKAVFLEQEGI